MATAPTAPKPFIRPDAVAPNQLDFYWGPPASDGGSPVTCYILQMTSPSTFTQDITAPADETSVYNLVDGKQYFFTIAASNGYGLSPAAAFRPIYVGYEPGVIGDYGVIPSDPFLHQVRWTRPFGNGYAPTIYHAIKSFPADGGGNPIQGTASTIVTPAFANQFKADILPLNSSIQYTHLIQAINDPGYSPATTFTQPAICLNTLPANFSPSSIAGLQTWVDAADRRYISYSNDFVSSVGNKANPDPVFTYNRTIADGVNGDTLPSIGSTINGLPTIGFHVGSTPNGALKNSYGAPLPNLTDLFFVYSLQKEGGRFNDILTTGIGTDFATSTDGKYIAISNYPVGSASTTQITNYGSTFGVASTITFADINQPAILHLQNISTSSLGVSFLCSHGVFNPADGFAGYVGELLTYSTPLAQSDIDSVNTYLSRKWGIQPYGTNKMTLWLDGDSNVGAVQAPGNSTIVGWNDSSLYGNGSKGIYNSQNLTYDADSGSVFTRGDGAGFTLGRDVLPNDNSDFSMFSVYNIDQIRQQTLFAKGSVGNFNGFAVTFWNNNQESIDLPNGQVYYGPETPLNTTFISEVSYNSSIMSIYRNGSAMNTFTGSFDRSQPVNCNCTLLYGDYQNFSGTLSECMIFNRSITQTERNAINQYLGNKYLVYPFYTPPFNNFQPSELPGLKLWLDGADPTTFTFSSGSNVSVWADKSAYANNASNGVDPAYNSNDKFVYFNSSNYLRLPDGTLPAGDSPFTAFIVASNAYPGPGEMYMLSAGTTTPLEEVSFINNPGIAQFQISMTFGAGTQFYSYQYIDNNKYVFSFAYAPNNADIYLNNDLRAQSNIPSRNGQSISTMLGWNFGESAGRFYGNMYEVVVFDQRLNERDMDTMYNYLRGKYF